MKLQITVEGKTYEVEVEVLEEGADEGPANYATYPPPSATYELTQAQGSPIQDGAGWEDTDGGKVCRSPITGLVIRVDVAAGQTVEAHDLLMVLEAMKMETNVTAPGAGKVKSVRVAAGDPVKVNQMLVEFE